MHWFDAIQAARRAGLRQLLKGRFAAFGEGTSYDPVTSRITGYEQIYLGSAVFIGPYAIISAYRQVSIGDDTIIGAGCTIITGNHRFRECGVPYRALHEGENKPVTIGRNVWIGSRVTILADVVIGDGAVIAAGALVSKDVPPFAIVAGVPAHVVGERFDAEHQEIHRRTVIDNLSQPGAGARGPDLAAPL